MPLFFKYFYNLYISFVVLIVINSSIVIFLIKQNILDSLFVNGLLLAVVLFNILDHRNRMIMLKDNNAHEKISIYIITSFFAYLLTTFIPLLLYFNILDLKNNQIYADTISYNALIFASIFISINVSFFKDIFYGLAFLMSPVGMMIMSSHDSNVQIARELRKARRMIEEKFVCFEVKPIKYSIKSYKNIEFNIFLGKNKNKYKVANDMFFYNQKSFSKEKLYEYLKSQNLKIDTMSSEDWCIAEMYLIN